MSSFCIVEGDIRCPFCKTVFQTSSEKTNHCIACNKEFRTISKARIKNNDFIKPINKFVDGQLIMSYRHVYEIYPEDNVNGKKNRDKVIACCRGMIRKSLNKAVYKFANEISNIEEEINNSEVGNKILQINFEGNIMATFRTQKEVIEKLGHSSTTIKKCYTNLCPPTGKEYFLILKKDYSKELVMNLIKSVLEKSIIVKDNGVIVGEFDTLVEAANKYCVSAPTIRNWIKRKNNPWGLEFCEPEKVAPIIQKNTLMCCSGCRSMEYLKEKLLAKDDQINNIKLEKETLEQKNFILKGEVNKLKKSYTLRKFIYDKRIPFRIPIEQFIKEKANLLVGEHVYILVDQNGRYYVGQCRLSSFGRILKHFSDTNDEIYKAYNNGLEFFVERIVIGFENIYFNLDDVEAYCIAYYNSYFAGYNQTQGNHLATDMGRYDREKIDLQ